MTDLAILFRDAMQSVFGQLDLLPIADGTIHRFYVSGDKAGSKNGWYVLYLDRIASGAFGSWKSGCSHTWSSRKPTDSIEAQLIAQRSNQARQQRKAERARKQFAAAAGARRLWSGAGTAQIDHNYTNCKRSCKSVASNYLRQDGETILVPLYAEGLLMNLQRIYPDGTKRFMYGGKV
ncbi:MAG: topoisomerase, partial [Pseudomonas sp.]|nr:topoisomerase [Pseudomonas sp.]